MSVAVYDPRACTLGEGPLWHPERRQLFWFDIVNKRMLSRKDDLPLAWQFDRCVSAAGWVDHDTLLIASETDLFLFDLETGEAETLCALEHDQPETRSNDGRADPWGGFWIGTMDKKAASGAGSIYRWFDGTLTPLFRDLSIPNAICFSPDRKYAFFTDTRSRQIQRQPLDPQGWPMGAPELFVDLRAEGVNPDGAVVDAEGCLWNAQWGAARVVRYAPDGQVLSHLPVPALQTSCPAFGGDDLYQLFITSAREGLDTPSSAQGQTFRTKVDQKGQPEHRVRR